MLAGLRLIQLFNVLPQLYQRVYNSRQAILAVANNQIVLTIFPVFKFRLILINFAIFWCTQTQILEVKSVLSCQEGRNIKGGVISRKYGITGTTANKKSSMNVSFVKSKKERVARSTIHL